MFEVHMMIQELAAFFCAATVFLQVSPGEADHHLPAPTQLTYKWLDPFTINVTWSWARPDDLPTDCEVQYNIHHDESPVRTTNKYYVHYLKENVDSFKWKLNIHTECESWNKSKEAQITISRLKPYAKLVVDFKCFYKLYGLDCSWIPVNPSSEPKVYYRESGMTEKNLASLQTCDPPDRIKERRNCFLKLDYSLPLLVVAETDTAEEILYPEYKINLTELAIQDIGDYLRLTWTTPEFGQKCDWIYHLSYKECDVTKHLKTIDYKSSRPVVIPYDKCCKYEFQYHMETTAYCPEVTSDSSSLKPYGETKPCVRGVTVVVFVMPILLFLCVTLSCYCFHRNRSIFCQNWQDPSGFKTVLNRFINQKDMVYTPPTEQTQTTVVLLTNNEL